MVPYLSHSPLTIFFFLVPSLKNNVMTRSATGGGQPNSNNYNNSNESTTAVLPSNTIISSESGGVKEHCSQNDELLEPTSWPKSLPSWADIFHRRSWGDKLTISEWDDHDNEDNVENNDDEHAEKGDVTKYRVKSGWRGKDLIHSRDSAVRILEYRLSYNDSNGNDFQMGEKILHDTVPYATLTGIVHFTPRAESHKGYCHGGSMCSALDDIIGWTGFCATGTCIPWSGFTVQVNTQMSKPVQVDSILKISCTIIKMERRKVWVKAYLTDPTDCISDDGDENIEKEKDTSVHAIGEGLIILNKEETTKVAN